MPYTESTCMAPGGVAARSLEVHGVGVVSVCARYQCPSGILAPPHVPFTGHKEGLHLLGKATVLQHIVMFVQPAYKLLCTTRMPSVR